jgi:hypothetical protein
MEIGSGRDPRNVDVGVGLGLRYGCEVAGVFLGSMEHSPSVCLGQCMVAGWLYRGGLSVGPVVRCKRVVCVDNVPKHRFSGRCEAVAIGLKMILNLWLEALLVGLQRTVDQLGEAVPIGSCLDLFDEGRIEALEILVDTLALVPVGAFSLVGL